VDLAAPDDVDKIAEIITEANLAVARRDFLAGLEGYRQAKVAFFVRIGTGRAPFFVVGDKLEHHDFGGSVGVCARAHRAELYDADAPTMIASPASEWIQVANVYRSLRQVDLDEAWRRRQMAED
jgi:hypothetical protein